MSETPGQPEEEEVVEQPAPVPQQEAPATRSERSPAGRALNVFHRAGDSIAESLESTGRSIQKVMRNNLRFEDPGNAERGFLLMRPFEVAGDLLDATVLNVVRRAHEITESAAGALGPTYNLATRPLFHPLDTARHPLKYLGNALKLATVAIKTTAVVALAPLRLVNDFVNRGIKRPLQRIPLVGGITGLPGRLAGWLSELPKRAGEWGTNWTISLDNAVPA